MSGAERHSESGNIPFGEVKPGMFVTLKLKEALVPMEGYVRSTSSGECGFTETQKIVNKGANAPAEAILRSRIEYICVR